MPGIKRRFVNLGSSRSVEKRSLKQKKFEVQLNTVKKVRICYTDPDATDSDSDVNRDDRNVGRKRIVHEIIRICDSAYKKSERKPSKKYQVHNFSEEGYPERPFQKMRSLKEIFGKSDVKILRPSSSSSYIGVQKRKSGKFAAEIRDPFTRKRVWLGTCDNEENAAIAYQVKKLEFDQFRMMDKNSIMSTTSAVQNLENTSFASDETNDRCSHPSPSSVLDMASSVPNVKSHAKPSKQANSVAMLDVDIPVLASVPSKYINAVEELQSSSENQSVPVFSCPESIQGTWDTMQFGTEGLQISGCLADPYSSPLIIQEIYLEENLQQEGNDLKVLGFEDLEPGIFPEEMFYDPERLHNDLLEINKEMLTWVDRFFSTN